MAEGLPHASDKQNGRRINGAVQALARDRGTYRAAGGTLERGTVLRAQRVTSSQTALTQQDPTLVDERTKQRKTYKLTLDTAMNQACGQCESELP